MKEKLTALLQDKKRMKELILYVVFGVLTTLVNWAVYFLVTKLGGLDGMAQESAGYFLLLNAAQVLAWIVAVLFAFFTNKRYVFESTAQKKSAWREFLLFVSARVLSLLVIELGLFNLLLLCGLGELWSKLIESAAVIVFNYVASKLVVFRKKQ